MEDGDLLCTFCNAMLPGKYTCPRCNKRYCSSECYKSQLHSACSELFFRECFMEGLQDMVVNGEERNKIAEMLHRLESEQPSDIWSSDSESEDLSDRLSGIDLDHDTDKIWHRLTTAERKEFENMLNDGSVAGLVSLWTPWWITGVHTLVEEITDESHPRNLPQILANIPDIGKLHKSGIDSSVPWNIINVLYGYAYVARLYNGDHRDMASESAQVLWDVSEALGQGVYPDPAMAVAGCISQLDGGAARKHFVSVEYSCAVISDVCQIIDASKSNEFALAALSECHQIFYKARREIGRGEELLRRRYQAVQKKIEFFISWTKSFETMLHCALGMLEIESCRLLSELVSYRSKHSQVEKVMSLIKERGQAGARTLITEIETSGTGRPNAEQTDTA